MTLDTVSGQTLIQEQVASILVQPLEAASVVLASGPRIFDSSEPLKIPTLTGSTDPSWVAENELIPDSEVTFGEINLMPSDRKSIKALTKFSNEMARQSNIGLDAVLKARIVKDVADKLDTALLIGDGTLKTVTGITKQAGTQAAVLGATDADSFLDALALAAAAEVTPNRWLMSGADFFTIRKLKDTSGKYLLESDITTGTTYRLFGIPVTVTNKLAAGKAVLADMSQVAVVRDIAPSVTVLSERFAEYDQQAIRVVTRYDLGLLHPEGVVILTAAPVV
ncbi:phage major capsid protein [Arthrobacter sp. H14]|uniref:phage major capsid protein n=1 Tax=Arthrobacter sp. H14 TaxID=1312959 RepID=UPI00047E6656|nr:phage major capsid protein [Arthrobacter sp. H14]